MEVTPEFSSGIKYLKKDSFDGNLMADGKNYKEIKFSKKLTC